MNYSAGVQLVMGESIRQTDAEASPLNVGAARTLLGASGARADSAAGPVPQQLGQI